ncbi:MAG: hypothetical protein ACJASK_002191, partial [Ilumatobacter sp.]
DGLAEAGGNSNKTGNRESPVLHSLILATWKS